MTASLSLCSYTYNDGHLLHGLLAHLREWDRLPDEIILVDDGSSPPFALGEEEKILPVRLLRLPANQGIVPAKHRGISAASGEIVLSVDCDSRLSPDFASRAVEKLRDPAVGMFSGWSGVSLGDDLFTRYSNIFGDIRKAETSGPVDFIDGAAFALRQSVWDEAGGFSGHDRPLGEDHYLCKILRYRGYQLYMDIGVQIRHARLLSRQGYCARFWKWCGPAWLKEAPPELSLPEYYQNFFGIPMLKRCATVLRHFPLEFLYFELLHMCFIPLALAGAMGAAGRIPQGSAAALRDGLKQLFTPYPLLRRLLKADCLQSGALPLHPDTVPPAGEASRLACVCDWNGVLESMAYFERCDLLEQLDKEGIRNILKDEAAHRTDFSSYLENPGQLGAISR